MIENMDQRSKDYSEIKDKFRPGHADFTYDAKYGMRDYRGGGRSFGARDRHPRRGRRHRAQNSARGHRPRRAGADRPAHDRPRHWDWDEIENNPFFCPDAGQGARAWKSYLDGIRKAGSSTGAVIEVVAEGVPPGLGAPIYGKLDADLAAALMTINAVKGVEIGAGFGAAALTGEENADEMRTGNDGTAQFLLEPRRRRSGRHFHRPAGRGALCGEADLLDPDAAPDGRPLRPRHRHHDQGPPRPLRRHPRGAGGEAMMACVLADHLLRHRGQVG